jgi:hypothetical protein
MRFLFLLIVIANLAAFALGQGVFGQAPFYQGLQANQPKEINPQAVKLGQPESPAQAARQ